jgi:uncharacterized protein
MHRGTLTLRREDGRVICESCTVADTTLRRMRGLLGRSGLKPDYGVVLRPAWSIHTAFMRFPIDVVFLDPDQTVIRIEPRLRPWKTASCRGAREVVELAGGECERRGLHVGDRVAWASTVADPALVDVSATQPLVPKAAAEDVRVVVVTRDRRFAKLMHFLLSRRGIEATTSTRDSVLDVIERDRADVVVLDAPDSLLAAARAHADAKALYPNVTVLVVMEGSRADAHADLTVYDKWDGMNEVVDSVSAAIAAASAA